MNFRVFDSVSDLVSSLAATIVRHAETSRRTVISLSGGTTPEVLYKFLGRGEPYETLAKRSIVWVMGDERCVPPHDAMSNTRMVYASLFVEGVAEGHEVLRFRTELEDPARIAADFEERWRVLGIESLDLALLGVGDDGHTASLFPGTPVLDVEDRIASEVWIERMASWRVTLTKPVLRAANSRIVIANGAKKKEILTRIRSGERYPIADVMEGDGDAWWFVDRDAWPGEE